MALFADRLEEVYGLLAHHYARAEAWEKAQDYLLKVGAIRLGGWRPAQRPWATTDRQWRPGVGAT